MQLHHFITPPTLGKGSALANRTLRTDATRAAPHHIAPPSEEHLQELQQSSPQKLMQNLLAMHPTTTLLVVEKISDGHLVLSSDVANYLIENMTRSEALTMLHILIAKGAALAQELPPNIDLCPTEQEIKNTLKALINGGELYLSKKQLLTFLHATLLGNTTLSKTSLLLAGTVMTNTVPPIAPSSQQKGRQTPKEETPITLTLLDISTIANISDPKKKLETFQIKIRNMLEDHTDHLDYIVSIENLLKECQFSQREILELLRNRDLRKITNLLASALYRAPI
jgi:hypothetical protein